MYDQSQFEITLCGLDFRWEVFNVFNRVILGGPDSGITSQSFGRITSAQPPRQMQFGLKLYF